MVALLFFFYSILSYEYKSVIDFSSGKTTGYWQVVNDGVMGGLSNGTFTYTEKGNGVFSGFVSLENNGGFSMVRHDCGTVEVEQFTHIKLKVKGDGQPFAFRIKGDRTSFFSYEYIFESTGDWQEISIPLAEMIPVFRGRKLNYPNFHADTVEEISFLRGNKRAENFRLEIEHVHLVK